MNKEISLDDLTKRVQKLEQVVFGAATSAKVAAADQYKGATGGLRFLLVHGFFDKKRTFAETKAELEKNGYNYSRQAVQTPLTRLSHAAGPLVSLTEKGKNAYAKRK